jgi:prepilin signal peptidase PulO-like enzyme (type II secretory pathway)
MQIFIFSGLLGWISGVVVNYIADVYPMHRKLEVPSCSNCSTPQNWVFNRFFTGACSACGQRVSIRAKLIILLFPFLAITLRMMPLLNLNFFQSLLLFTYLSTIMIIDIEYHLIYHIFSIVGVVLGIWIGVILHGLGQTLLGGLGGFLGMFILYLFGYLFIKITNNFRREPVTEEALGFGDVNLAGVLGLIMGWPGILIGLTLAILLGGVVSFVYILINIIRQNFSSSMAIPYGPFLIAGSIFVLLLKNIVYAH